MVADNLLQSSQPSDLPHPAETGQPSDHTPFPSPKREGTIQMREGKHERCTSNLATFYFSSAKRDFPLTYDLSPLLAGEGTNHR